MSKITVNRENHDAARRYFGILGNKEYDLHHKDENLINTDPERYNEWRPEDLEVITHAEHSRLHCLSGNKGGGWGKGVKGAGNGANTHPEKNNFINNNPSKKGMVSHTKGMHYKIINGRHIYYRDGETIGGKMKVSNIYRYEVTEPKTISVVFNDNGSGDTTIDEMYVQVNEPCTVEAKGKLTGDTVVPLKFTDISKMSVKEKIEEAGIFMIMSGSLEELQLDVTPGTSGVCHMIVKTLM